MHQDQEKWDIGSASPSVLAKPENNSHTFARVEIVPLQHVKGKATSTSKACMTSHGDYYCSKNMVHNIEAASPICNVIEVFHGLTAWNRNGFHLHPER